jgi:hypothetical protein
MTYSEALTLAKGIQQQNPNYILCGSVALILLGKLQERDVGDLDFCCPREFFAEEKMVSETSYPPKENGGEYLCYKVVKDSGYYNVFIHSNLELKLTEIDGIKCQDSEQILHFKKLYNREKDQKDLTLVASQS